MNPVSLTSSSVLKVSSELNLTLLISRFPLKKSFAISKYSFNVRELEVPI